MFSRQTIIRPSLHNSENRTPRQGEGVGAPSILCTSPCPLLGLCTSSLRRGHANLLCIVPSFDKDPNRLCQSKLDSRSFDNIPLTGIWAQARKIKSRHKPAVPHTSFHQALRCLTSEVKENAVQSMRGDIAFSKVTRKSQESSPA